MAVASLFKAADARYGSELQNRHVQARCGLSVVSTKCCQVTTHKRHTPIRALCISPLESGPLGKHTMSAAKSDHGLPTYCVNKE